MRGRFWAVLFGIRSRKDLSSAARKILKSNREPRDACIEVGRGIKKAAALCAAGFGLFCSEFGAERIFRAQQEKS